MTPIRVLTKDAVRRAEADRQARADAERDERRRRKARPPEMANISRVDSGKTHGWLVRFQRGDDKRGKLFSDRKHGGADESLAAAQAWRDEQREDLGPTRELTAAHLQTADMRRRNRRSVNTSGVTGIGVTHRTFGQSSVPYVTAYWIDPGGRRRQSSFSTARHGLEGALRLAAKVRAGTAEWHGEPPMTADEIVDAALDGVQALAEAR